MALSESIESRLNLLPLLRVEVAHSLIMLVNWVLVYVRLV